MTGPWMRRVGFGILVVWIAWAVISAALAGEALSPVSPYVVAPLALAVGLWVGDPTALKGRAPRAQVVLLLVALLLLVGVLATRGPAKEPLEYANANAALAVQVVGLVGIVITRARGRVLALAVLTVAICTATVLANRSIGGAATVVPVLAAVVVGWLQGARRRPWLVAVAAVSVTAASVAVVREVIQLSHSPQWPPAVLRALDPARKSLWSDAWSAWSHSPWVGIGPGQFEHVSRWGSIRTRRRPTPQSSRSASRPAGWGSGSSASASSGPSRMPRGWRSGPPWWGW